MTEKVRAIIIVEIMGRPAEHAKASLESHVNQFRSLKGVEVFSTSTSEPKKVEDSKEEIYTCFSEIEFETINLSRMIEIVFDFMPSSIEILEPEEITLDIANANGFLNDLAGRLHKYDELVKIAQFRAQQFAGKLHEMIQEKEAKKAKKKK